MRVLDIGCGTAGHLAGYAEAGAVVVGVDRSRAMLRRAAVRLGGRVLEGDASRLPLATGTVDLVIVSMVLHELQPAEQRDLLGEALRVARAEGRLLVIDYLPEPSRSGRLAGRLAASIERVAGGDHHRNYRSFLANGGLPALAGGLDMVVEDRAVAAAGIIGAYLIRRPGPMPREPSGRPEASGAAPRKPPDPTGTDHPSDVK
jgi:demethylmenaquinone methyltransferase/2-methoxy-6-polyprenyl-1,4-benzoquinol methylase